MSRVFFTSDHHFGHENIIGYCLRPFDNVRNMNWAMTNIWNDVVGPRDIVYHLGDFAMGEPDDWPKFCKRLNGYKILVRGNHDRSAEKMLAVGFDEVHDNIVREIDGVRMWMNHYPLNNEDDVRGKRRPPAPSPYDIALCGHIHQHWRVKSGCVNVGVDVWGFRPISLAEIQSVLAVADETDT